MNRTINAPVTFNRNPVTSNRGLQKLGKNVFWSLALPLTFTIIALILAHAAGNSIFIGQTGLDTTRNIMSLIKTITMTIIAAMALNANLNSGRMDFSLGATGVLSVVIAGRLLNNQITSVGDVMAFLFVSIAAGMIIGLVNSFIFMILKIPPIVTSLGMCLVFEGIASVLSDKNTVKFITNNNGIAKNLFLEPIIIIPLLIVVAGIMMFALCYTKWGYNKNALVWNQKISVDTGIKEIGNCIGCFVLGGALIAIYQVMSVCDTPELTVAVNLGTAGTVFKNFLPIFIGGILAKYSNQIGGLLLAVFATCILDVGLEAAIPDQDVISLINGLMVFSVLVYMVDKDRFVNWVKKQKYIHTQKRLGRETSGEEN